MTEVNYSIREKSNLALYNVKLVKPNVPRGLWLGLRRKSQELHSGVQESQEPRHLSYYLLLSRMHIGRKAGWIQI